MNTQINTNVAATLTTAIDGGKGWAHGGATAMADALRLWASCAVGGADYSMLPFNDASAFVRLKTAIAGFDAAVTVMTENWYADRVDSFQQEWRDTARETLFKAAGHLLAACKEVERANRADAGFSKKNGNLVAVFSWSGHWTHGRMIDVEVSLDDELEVSAQWDTATGKESTYLSLPSATDEAEKTDHREGGWSERHIGDLRGPCWHWVEQ